MILACTKLLGKYSHVCDVPFQVALFDISIANIDCRYIDTFEKYRYRYRYRYGHFEDIDIDKSILENIDIKIDID